MFLHNYILGSVLSFNLYFTFLYYFKVKLIKTRLRSTVGQNRLESLVLLSTEKDIAIDYNEAINKFALTSDLLTKELMFK